ncbi:hypothetical protein MTO96_044254 [Rhipicephalus appendiculatus]
MGHGKEQPRKIAGRTKTSRTWAHGMIWFPPWYLRILYFQLLLSLNTIVSLPVDEPEGFVTTIAEVQRIAETKLKFPIRQYIGSGAGEEQTLKENIRAFKRLRFRPRSLVDVSQPKTSTTVLGQTIAFPIGFSPSALHRIADDAGEKATAKAAQGASTVMILSAMSSTMLEDVRASAPNLLLWQQLYLFRNRSLTKSIVKRAEMQGYAAIVVTVDSPIQGQAAFISKNSFRLPEGVGLPNLEAWNPDETFNFDPTSEGFIGEHISSSATWDDILWLRSVTSLPIVAKGVLTPQQAMNAVNHGAAAIIVSNHGGRVLDGTPATIEVLPDIVAAVGNRTEVYMDGGIRSGADAVKALSLGARAVFIGRPVVWGLAYNGVEKVLSLLHGEFVRTMQLLGCPDSSDLNHDYVVREEYYRQFEKDIPGN